MLNRKLNQFKLTAVALVLAPIASAFPALLNRENSEF